MSGTRLAIAALLSAVLAPAALYAPATENATAPIRVRPGHARAASAAPSAGSAVPVRLTADASPADTALAPEPEAAPDEPVETEARPIGGGIASYYGAELAGNPTASGERFDPSGLTVAHRTLPFGTMLEVTNPKTGASVVVRVNDRGPFHRSRLIDLSEAAARRIGLVRAGTGRVEIAVVGG